MTNDHDEIVRPGEFLETDRDAIYRCIFERRDVRSGFQPDPIPDSVLARILRAGHHAPSVGFMQPWDFVVVRGQETRQAVKAAFIEANTEAAGMFPGERGDKYRSLKLEGILEAPVGLCITCDHSRHGPVVLGRTHQPATDLYSVVCAVQNIWLAARAEGIGVGWVSILRLDALRAALSIPATIEPVAYLCLGYVDAFAKRPDLEAKGWLTRLRLSEVVSFEQFRAPGEGDGLAAHLDG